MAYVSPCTCMCAAHGDDISRDTSQRARSRVSSRFRCARRHVNVPITPLPFYKCSHRSRHSSSSSSPSSLSSRALNHKKGGSHPPCCGVSVLRSFLDSASVSELVEFTRTYSGGLTPETSSFATNRVGMKDDAQGTLKRIFSSSQVTNRIRRAFNDDESLSIAPFPPELRVYRQSAYMDWHQDESLFEDEPHVECVYTLSNTTDSETHWRLPDGDARDIKGEWLAPNTCLVLLAGADDAPFHKVTPVTNRGERTIVKFAFSREGAVLRADYEEGFSEYGKRKAPARRRRRK